MAKNDFSAESAVNYEQKCLCVLVLDVSGSMRGEPINELNRGLQEFYNEIKGDETTSQRLEVCIMTFKQKVVTKQEPALIDDVVMPTLMAKGSTAMVDAVNEAIELVAARKKWYKETGQTYFRPWIILMTDGEPDDGQDVEGLATRIKKDTEAKNYVFLPIGIEDANMQTLETIKGNIPPQKMKGLKFMEFFKWLSASMGTIVTHTEGETVNLAPKTVDDDWMSAFEIPK
jgi:uncharacterized protein YegL